MTTKKIIVDLDGTITRHAREGYDLAEPNLELIDKLRQYQAAGFEIAVHTSRNMRTHKGNVGKINLHTLPVAIEWLQRHQVPFDEIHVGKPWCGEDGFYVDDRAIRPSEFVKYTPEELQALLNGEKP